MFFAYTPFCCAKRASVRRSTTPAPLPLLTPDQFCRLLVNQGLLDEGKILPEATMATLKYLETEEG